MIVDSIIYRLLSTLRNICQRQNAAQKSSLHFIRSLILLHVNLELLPASPTSQQVESEGGLFDVQEFENLRLMRIQNSSFGTHNMILEQIDLTLLQLCGKTKLSKSSLRFIFIIKVFMMAET